MHVFSVNVFLIIMLAGLNFEERFARNSLPIQAHFSLFPTCREVPNTQVNRMFRSRRVLATGGKQRIFWLDMVFIETILIHLDSF